MMRAFQKCNFLFIEIEWPSEWNFGHLSEILPTLVDFKMTSYWSFSNHVIIDANFEKF